VDFRINILANIGGLCIIVVKMYVITHKDRRRFLNGNSKGGLQL
jgi:hypothetical protein